MLAVVERYGRYHRWVASLPCIAHGKGVCIATTERARTEAHHLRSIGAGGHDYGNEVPVCPRHHDMLHTIGQYRFEKKYGLDLQAKAEEVRRRWDERENDLAY